MAQVALVLFGRLIVARHVHLDVLPLYFLHRRLLVHVVFPVLIELREASSHIVDKELGEFLVRLNDEAEELAVVIVNDVAKLLLEREWLEVFPSEILSLENKDSVL